MNTNPRPHDVLKRIFHEPNRLAIMSALCAADGGLTFTQLKEACTLTDGNLSQHLRALQQHGAIRIDKAFVGLKPQTTVYLSDQGLTHFADYLDALEEVLREARRALAEDTQPAPDGPLPAPDTRGTPG
jgi:DNA-binding transcriptional ArsR family regulator